MQSVCKLAFVIKPEKIQFKNKLKQSGETIIQQRIAATQIAINNAQQAANSEEKSSAGDKYETGRAMGHLEKDMHTRQLTEHINELASLHAVDVNIAYPTVTTGSFIQCDTVSFFIAAGLGKQIIDGNAVLFLSPKAPLARSLWGKQSGDQVIFNRVLVTIRDVY
jgi:hypothetical protein